MCLVSQNTEYTFRDLLTTFLSQTIPTLLMPWTLNPQGTKRVLFLEVLHNTFIILIRIIQNLTHKCSLVSFPFLKSSEEYTGIV